MNWKLPGCLLGLCLQLMVIENAAAVPATYLQSFEQDSTGWADPSLVSRVASGSPGNYADNVRASVGSYFARLSLGEASTCAPPNSGTVYTGPSTRLGCYGCTFPVGGYSSQVRVYLDTAYAVTNPDKGFDLTSAVNDTSCNGRRDFVFKVTTCGPNHDTTCGATGVAGFVIGASANAGRCGVDPADPSTDPIYVTNPGWYTFEHVFRNVGGILVGTMNLRSPSGSLVKSWSLSNSTDVIGTTVGGNRYVWFANQQIAGLAIDNVVRVGGQVCGDYSCNLRDGKVKSCRANGTLSQSADSTMIVRCSNGSSLQDADASVTPGARSVSILGDNGSDVVRLNIALPDTETGAGTSRMETSLLSGNFEGMCNITQP